VAKAVGFLGDGDTSALFQAPVLRSEEEIDQLRRKLLGIHWRMTEHRVNGPKHVDFLNFAKDNWFGGFDPTGIATANGDLAISGKALTEANPDTVRLATSISSERHIAANWLMGSHPLYSQVVAPT
jgi:hypothetical protein